MEREFTDSYVRGLSPGDSGITIRLPFGSAASDHRYNGSNQSKTLE